MTEFLAQKEAENSNVQNAVERATSRRHEAEDDDLQHEHAKRRSSVFTPRAPLISNAQKTPQAAHPTQ
jgi:hypothetical protein